MGLGEQYHAKGNEVTTGGWIIMFISVGGVVSLFLWCIIRVLVHKPAPPVEHMHGLDIDTRDTD